VIIRLMELFNKLLMMRQLKFQLGEIDLLNQRVVLAPGAMLRNFTYFMIKHPETVPEIYELMRLSFDEGWAEPVKKAYGFKSKDFFRWLIDLSNVAGWGTSELVSLDEPTSSGVFRTRNAVVSKYLVKKYSEPVCHIWRGLTAGGTTAVFKKDMDWVEIKCLGKGDDCCEFVFKPRELMRKESNPLFLKQLPIYQ